MDDHFRRVRKIVEEYDGGSWSEALDRKFVWYNWLLLAELDGEDDSVVKKYTWGLDLTGQQGGAGVSPASLESAGGIGGLLATRDEVLGKSYAHFYDANGNTGQLILRGDGSTAAAYAYDAYGNVTAQTGSYADDNAWRFSTKQWDDETGLGYWGERYYDCGEGRWLSRDPVAEKGGLNLYSCVGNAAVNIVDPDGRFWGCCAACWLWLGGDIGGGAAGCLWGCADYAHGDYSLWGCFKDCMRMYGEDRLDHTDLFNLYKSILEGAACSCCLRKKLGKDPPPPAPAGPEGSNDDPRPEPLDPQVPDGDDLPTGFCDDLAQQILNALGDGDFGMAGALQKIFDDLCDDGPGKQEPKPIPFPKPKPCPERKAA